MGLKDVLQKMKLIETVESMAPEGQQGEPASPAAASKPGAPALVGLQGMIDKLPPPKFDDKALGAAHREEGGPDFPAVYKAAGVADPAHGYTAFKVLEILCSDGFLGLETKAKAAAIAGFLRMNPSGAVPIKDVIQDAIRRDQALDGFEEFLRKKLEGRSQQLEQENAQLQAEVDALARRNRERVEANRVSLAKEQQKFADWQAKKRAEERKLFDAVAPFVEHNPVTLSGSASAGPSAPRPAAPKSEAS